MEFNWMSLLFGAFGLGVLQILWEGIKFYINRRDKQKSVEQIFTEKQEVIENLFNDLISSAVRIQELGEEFVEDNDVGRLTILKMENGGGIPQLGTVQHISILSEAIHPNHKYPDGSVIPSKQDIQDHTVGQTYQRLMTDMISDKILIKDTIDLDDGLLKRLFESSKIHKFILLPIIHIPALGHEVSKGFLIYMSIQFMNDRVIDPKLESEYIILREKISQIFKEFYIKRIGMIGDGAQNH
jgi:hypothetical protein